MPPSVNGLSLFWTALCLAGLLAGAWNAREAWLDRRALHGAGAARSHLLRVQAIYSLGIEIARFFVQLVGLTLGLFSMWIPAAPISHQSPAQLERRLFYGGVIVLGLILIEVGQVVIIGLDFWRRARLDRLGRHLMEQHEE